MQEPQRVFKLNLEKYGLSHLDSRNILDLNDSDLEAFLKALGTDDISITVPIPFTPQNVKELLSQAVCRTCGECCIPNPLNPDGPGVEVFDDELKIIAHYRKSSYEGLWEGTVEGKNRDNPWPLDEIISTRLLPLPCAFYDEKTRDCLIYEVRPLVCTIYPIVLSDNDDYMDIKVNCDYGKEVATAAIQKLRTENPELILRI